MLNRKNVIAIRAKHHLNNRDYKRIGKKRKKNAVKILQRSARLNQQSNQQALAQDDDDDRDHGDMKREVIVAAIVIVRKYFFYPYFRSVTVETILVAVNLIYCITSQSELFHYKYSSFFLREFFSDLRVYCEMNKLPSLAKSTCQFSIR